MRGSYHMCSLFMATAPCADTTPSGLHFIAFCPSQSRRAWLIFDDSHWKEYGDMAEMRARSVAGKVQPVVLLYEQQLGAPARLPTRGASKKPLL